MKATNITWHEGHVDRASREGLLAQSGVLLWFTGLSGSGKSTIHDRLFDELSSVHALMLPAARTPTENLRSGYRPSVSVSYCLRRRAAA